jgi:hypothetical protein
MAPPSETVRRVSEENFGFEVVLAILNGAVIAAVPKEGMSCSYLSNAVVL